MLDHERLLMAPGVPAFPTAGLALGPLKQQAESSGRDDFSSLWCGQAAALCTEIDAGELTRRLAVDARERLFALA